LGGQISICFGSNLTENSTPLVIPDIKFRRGMEAQGFDRSTLPYKSPFAYYGAFYAIGMISVISFFSAWNVFLKGDWDTATFITSEFSLNSTLPRDVFFSLSPSLTFLLPLLLLQTTSLSPSSPPSSSERSSSRKPLGERFVFYLSLCLSLPPSPPPEP